MTFLDFGDSGPELDLDADLCVVGAGEAGLTIAHELRGSGLRICVVETGGLDRNPAADDLNDVRTDGHPTLDFHETRPRVFGGSTAAWGGMCCPLDACDFEVRPDMPLREWPISLADLAPFYERAHAALGLGPPYFDERLWEVLGSSPPPVDRTRLQTKFWQYRSPSNLPTDSPLRFGQAYRAELSAAPDATVVLNATVTAVERTPGEDRVDRVEIRSMAGRCGRIRARAFVLAAGTVENTRLLLSSEFRRCSDALGRYFMEHPHLPVGRVPYNDMRRILPRWPVLQRCRSMSLRPKFLPTPAFQVERDILNASMALEVRCPPDCPHLALSEIKAGLAEGRVLAGVGRATRRIVTNPTTIASATYRRYRGSDVCPGHAAIELYNRSEQEPNPSSRIVLSEERDTFGSNLAEISWRLTDRDRRTVVEFADLVVSELRRVGATGVTRESWLDEPTGWSPEIRGGPHHSGTTRMSESPATGVVDRDSRVHGVENLYVVGPSTFPAGGYANPTYTIVALAIRVADHVRARLRDRAIAG